MRNDKVKIKVLHVRWEADNMNDVEDLPSDVELEIDADTFTDYENDDDSEELISDELSNQYGFTHNGWASHQIISD
jgi:hypothetical protein